MKIQRLLKLARHLQKGKLGHLEFNFYDWHQTFKHASTYKHYSVPKSQQRSYCGFAGCAVGEIPVAFPELAAFGRAGSKHIFRNKQADGKLVPLKQEWHVQLGENSHLSDELIFAAIFFDIPVSDAVALFVPHEKRWWADHRLYNASAHEVGESIADYVYAVKQLNEPRGKRVFRAEETSPFYGASA